MIEYKVATYTLHVMKGSDFKTLFYPFFFFWGILMRSEAAYQRNLISKLEAIFPGCFIIKNDAATRQGIPDLLILWGDRWGMLEVKLSERSRIQPNQEHYIDFFSQMAFASFIFPENEEQVLYDLQSALGAIR